MAKAKNEKPCRPQTVHVRGYYVPPHTRSAPRAQGLNPKVFQRILESEMQRMFALWRKC